MTFVYCDQTVGWMKMPLCMEVGLGPGHIVFDGDPATPKKGRTPQFSAMSVVAKDATWYGGRPRPGRHCVRWWPSPPNGAQQPPFSTHVYCSQTVGWIKMALGRQVGLDQGHIVTWGPAPPPQKGHSPPTLGSCLLWPNGRMDEDATWYRGTPWPRRHCVRSASSSPPKRGHSTDHFSAHVYCGHTAG